MVDVRLAASGVGKSRRGGEELRGEGGEYPCVAGAVAEEFVVGEGSTRVVDGDNDRCDGDAVDVEAIAINVGLRIRADGRG